MSLNAWFRFLKQSFSAAGPNDPRQPQRWRTERLLFLERLEDRTLLNNDTLASAVPVPFPNNTAAVSGALTSPQDVKLFSLSLAAGDTVTAGVSTQRYGGGLDSYLRVFDSAGNQVAANNDFDGRDPRLTFQAAHGT